MSFSFDELRSAIANGAAGVRAITELEPLAGPRTKVAPPTYATADNAETKYATEKRRTGEVAAPVAEAVVLSSVASQANWSEDALLSAVRDGEIRMPLTSVDFTGDPDTVRYGRISDLECPHRVFDALIRDSTLDGVFFRLTKVGRAVTDATVANATAVFHHAPTALLFGAWDSTGPRGGLGAKYERAYTSEIVATGISVGVKTASRLDPLGIEKKAGPVYRTKEKSWSLDPVDGVATGKQGPAPLNPSDVNHGNIAPSIDDRAGGITADRIEATTVISFIQLRRLRFPTDISGAAYPTVKTAEVQLAARTALAALGICAAVLAFDIGFDLRSRCVLVPTGELSFELVGKSGTRTTFSLSRDEAICLLAEATAAAEAAGIGWRTEELTLQPTPQLAELLKRSIGIMQATPTGE